MTKEVSRFPITLWPESLVEPLPVQQGSVTRYSDGSLRWTYGPGAPALLEAELVLRELLDLDMADDAVLVDFCQEHGLLARRFTLITSFMTGALDHDGRGYHDLAAGSGCTHVEDLRLWLLTARAMVAHWLAYCDGEPVEDAWRQPHKVFDHVTNPWQEFAISLSEGLDAYKVRVSYVPPDLGQPLQALPDLFSAICLQVFNLIIEDLPVLTCANETCRRRFVRQKGGAEAGQFRTVGVRFCTPPCARAQTQREYRRRESAKEGDAK